MRRVRGRRGTHRPLRREAGGVREQVPQRRAGQQRSSAGSSSSTASSSTATRIASGRKGFRHRGQREAVVRGPVRGEHPGRPDDRGGGMGGPASRRWSPAGRSQAQPGARLEDQAGQFGGRRRRAGRPSRTTAGRATRRCCTECGARRRDGEEAHVEVPGRHAERAGDRMHVEADRCRVEDSAPIPLSSRASRGGRVEHGGVAGLAVPAELQPQSGARVQREQHRPAARDRAPARWR